MESTSQSQPDSGLAEQAKGLQAQKEQQLKGYGQAIINNPADVHLDASGNVMLPREVAEVQAKGNQDPAAR